MRIEELLVEQQIDELGMNDIGRGVGKAVGGVAKGLGAVAGGAVGAWDAAKAGFSAGRKTVGGTAPATGGTAPVTGGTAPVTGGTAPATGGTAPATGGTAPVAPTPAQQQQAAQQAKIGIGQINKIIPTLKTDQLNAIKKVIDQRTQALAAKRTAQTVTGTQQQPAATPTPAATPSAATTGVQTQAPMANPAINTATQQAFGAPRTFESVEFYSKFLNQKI